MMVKVIGARHMCRCRRRVSGDNVDGWWSSAFNRQACKRRFIYMALHVHSGACELVKYACNKLTQMELGLDS